MPCTPGAGFHLLRDLKGLYDFEPAQQQWAARMAATNSSGGVMGKMIDAQSICIATAATNQVGNEGMIFRFVFWHSVALAAIVGVIVMLYAYVFPQFIPHGLNFIH